MPSSAESAGSESLLEEDMEEEAGRGLLVALSSEESLEDEEGLEAAFFTDSAGLGFEAVTVTFVIEVGPSVEVILCTDVTLDFFAAGASLLDEDELEPDPELDGSLESDLRWTFFMRPLIVGFVEGALAPGASIFVIGVAIRARGSGRARR